MLLLPLRIKKKNPTKGKFSEKAKIIKFGEEPSVSSKAIDFAEENSKTN